MTDGNKVLDFTNLTCTNLMIKLKILTFKMKKGENIQFLTTREGENNLSNPFSKSQYIYSASKIKDNTYHVKIQKI